MRKLLKSKNNAEAVLNKYLNLLNVKVTSNTIDTCLNEHPEYPSLLSLSDCLSEWKIPNNAYQIDKADYDPNDLEYPIIAHLDKNDGSFILIHKIEANSVFYSDENHSFKKMSENKFLIDWDGIILHSIPTKSSGELNFNDQRVKSALNLLKYPLAAILISVLLILTLQQKSLAFINFGLIIVKIIGVATSILLLISSNNSTNIFIQSLCTVSKKSDCNAILNSDASKITSWLSWSEIGFFYFTGTLFSFLFVDNSVGFISILNLISLPYTVYSITYQYKAKIWCTLCCAIQAILWIEFFLLFNIDSYSISDIDFRTITLLLTSFFIPIISWSIAKPLCIDLAKLKPLNKQLKLFKYKTKLFDQLLYNQEKYATTNDLKSIKIGNLQSNNVITVVSSPYCNPCAKAHESLNELFDAFKDFELRIVFAASDNDSDDLTKVIRHLTALSFWDDQELIRKALDDWYSQKSKNYAKWSLKYPVEIDQPVIFASDEQKAWCNLVDITATPTILINGFKLPKLYTIKDLKYLIN